MFICACRWCLLSGSDWFWSFSFSFFLFSFLCEPISFASSDCWIEIIIILASYYIRDRNYRYFSTLFSLLRFSPRFTRHSFLSPALLLLFCAKPAQHTQHSSGVSDLKKKHQKTNEHFSNFLCNFPTFFVIVWRCCSSVITSHVMSVECSLARDTRVKFVEMLLCVSITFLPSCEEHDWGIPNFLTDCRTWLFLVVRSFGCCWVAR